MSRILIIVLLVMMVVPAFPAPAQDDDPCQTLVIEALQLAGSNCAAMGTNEACYGHSLVLSTVSPGVTFANQGDRASLLDVQALTTFPADPGIRAWGVAMMNVQADLPLDQDLMLVLVGDANLAPASTTVCTATAGDNVEVYQGPGLDQPVVGQLSAGQTARVDRRIDDWVHVQTDAVVGWVGTPLVTLDCPVESLPAEQYQAFVVSSGAAGVCQQAPDGLLVRSPEGERARVVVNGVQLEFASAGFISAQADATLAVTGLEGEITVTSQAQSVTVTPDQQTQVPLSGLDAVGPPAPPVPVDTSAFDLLLGQTAPTGAGASSTAIASGTWVFTVTAHTAIVNGQTATLNQTETDTAVLDVGPDGAVIQVDGVYEFVRVADMTYAASFLLEGANYEITVTFTSPTTFEGEQIVSFMSAEAGNVRVESTLTGVLQQ